MLPLLLAFAGGRASAQDSLEWDGYLQVRYTRTSQADSAFSVRRAKFWIAGKLPERFSYRVQARFSSPLSGALMLQDAWLAHPLGPVGLQAGQMVPSFSLERTQPDYVLPVVERARVVDALVPAAESSARDVGVQLRVPLSAHVRAFAGLFDGTGANQLQTRPHGYLVTQRTAVAGGLGHGVLAEIGYSLAMRQARDLVFKRIFGDELPYTGQDFRWGVDAQLVHPRWRVQGEYLQADLERLTAWGWYAFATYRPGANDELVAQAQYYHDLSPHPAESPWFGPGWNHFFRGDRAKLMLAGQARFDPDSTAYSAVAQLQLFVR